MKKIVIVGHPHSGYQDVESLLNVCGMTAARPSRREGFSPTEIGDILARAHAIPALNQVGEGRAIEQIEANSVWHGMALDLMLGNLEQNVWGWADPQAIFLLNYWRDLDQQITFMLVYDRPHSALARLSADEAASLSEDVLHKKLGNWAAYNSALLHFFHRNQQRCLLVHSEQVRASVSAYLQQVRARIDAPWSERMEQLMAPRSSTGADDVGTEQAGADGCSTKGMQVDRLESLAVPDREPLPVVGQNMLALYLADALVEKSLVSLQIYEELQAAANLPLAHEAIASCTNMQAWQAMSSQEQRLNELDIRISQKDILIESLDQARAAAEKVAQRRQGEIAQQARRHEALQQAKQESLQENELLLAQLHQLQEEVTRHYTERQQQEQRIKALQLHSENLAKAVKAAEKPAPVVERRDPVLEKENELLLAQLHQVQEKLERHLTERQLQEQKMKALQLQSEKLAMEVKAAAKPVPAAVQRDPAVEKENEQLLAQLHQLQEELERYALENKKLKIEVSKKPEPAPKRYGAANAVKQQLPYRLGATMLQRSRSVTGWLGMPAALSREARQFKRESEQPADSALSAIDSYADAHEAAKVRQHLSYRLGTVLVANTSSAVGWVKLPWALLRETRQYRAHRKTSTIAVNGASRDTTPAAVQ
jgi:hypothetical protein